MSSYTRKDPKSNAAKKKKNSRKRSWRILKCEKENAMAQCN